MPVEKTNKEEVSINSMDNVMTELDSLTELLKSQLKKYNNEEE